MVTKLASVLLVGTLALSGCGSSSATSWNTQEPKPAKSEISGPWKAIAPFTWTMCYGDIRLFTRAAGNPNERVTGNTSENVFAIGDPSCQN